MTPGALALTSTVCGLLDELGIPYVIGGSIASSLVGEPRATIDVDIAVVMGADAIPGLVDALGGEWYMSDEAAGDAVRRRGSFNLIHLETMQKVDLFVLGDGLLDANQMARRVPVEIMPGTTVWVGAAEDQVLRKLWWFELGGQVSERQWRDVVAILRVQAERLDGDYLDRVAEQVGLRALLDRARADV